MSSTDQILAEAARDPKLVVGLVHGLARVRVVSEWVSHGTCWERYAVNGPRRDLGAVASVAYQVRWDSACPYEGYLLVNGTEVALPASTPWNMDGTLTPEVAAFMEVQKSKLDVRLQSQGWLLLR